MKKTLVPLQNAHRHDVMSIINYYVKHSFAAYPEKLLPDSWFDDVMKTTEGNPAYVLVAEEKIIGFAFLRPYKPFSTFSETAEITYFIHPDYTGQGAGALLLERLETDAVRSGITAIFASIVSENTQSLQFHERKGFTTVGVLPGIGRKFGKLFDIIWMKKVLGKV